jgi:DNA-directed RNA polymerase specialized sigma24 family protein
MARYCSGELAAFLRLYQCTAPRILTYLATLTADGGLARELLEETFLRLHASRNLYVRGANPVPWISTLAHACFLHRQKRIRSVPLERERPAAVIPPAVSFSRAEKIR